MAEDRLRVLVVSSDPLARAGLAALLARDELEVESAAVAEGFRAQDPAPEAVLWDVGPESRSRALRLPLPDVPTVALISDPEQAAQVLAAGASGVLLRDASPSRLVEALRATLQGLVVLDEAVASAALRPAAPQPDADLAESLTAREREVLALLAEGLSNRLIAERLKISEHTAKFHVNAILGKLGAESRTEALVLATRLGLVTF